MSKSDSHIPFVPFVENHLGEGLSLGQKTFARVAFDGVDPVDLTDDEREVAEVLFGGVERVPPDARRVICARFGRGSGKSRTTSLYAIWRLCTADLSRVGTGDAGVFACVAPGRATAGIVLRTAREVVRRFKWLENRIEDETAEGFSWRREDGKLAELATFAASRGGHTLRGRTYAGAVLDEAEFFRSDQDFAVTDRDVFGAIMPRLLPGGSIALISTCWPVPTLMGELVERNWRAPQDALVAVGPTLLLRDGDPELAKVIAAERLRDPVNAAREYDCDASATGGDAFFDARALQACVDGTWPVERPRPEGCKVGIGVDVGLISDSSAIAVVAAVDGRFELLGLKELRPRKGEPLKLSEVIGHFAEVTKRYRETSFVADGHAREPAREWTQKEGVAILAAPENRKGKEETHLLARRLISEGRVKMGREPRLLQALARVIARPAAGGGFSFESPRRAGEGHGDVASAFILALWRAHELSQSSGFRGATGTDRGRWAGMGRGF